MTNRDYQTGFERIDGTKDNFSWIQCCQFKPKTDLEKLTIAMREAISNDIIEFKNTSVQECVYCFKQQVDFHVNSSGSHVVHADSERYVSQFPAVVREAA